MKMVPLMADSLKGMTIARCGAILAGLLLLTAGPVWAQTTPDDPVASARLSARSGDREEAIRLLRAHIERHPSDTDARTLLGTVLSWDGSYDEARGHLQFVLDGNPTHGDALPAMANLELWSGQHAKAESLSVVGLTKHPDNAALLITRARALWNLSREDEALDAVNVAVRIDPENETARGLRRSLRDTRRFWRGDVAYSFDSFSDGRGAWRETRYGLTRQTKVGSVIGRVYRAERFGYTDHQVEVDMYPRFRPGTYAYVSGAFAPESILFPSYRVGFDLYQSLGGGYEASGGFRRMQFTSAVTIYVGSLTKYRGNWMYTSRVFVTPNTLGPSTSVHAIARRYRSDGVGYYGLRYGRGAYRDEVRNLTDIADLSSDTFAAESSVPVGTLDLWVSGSASREGRAGLSDLWQFSVSSGLGVRF